MNIELRGLTKKYKSFRALDDVSLSLASGQIVALLGPNGAGKTTLLRCLAGTIAPQQGEILYDGVIFRRDQMDLRKRFLFLPDFPAVFEDWSPIAHMGMTLRLFGRDQPGIEQRVVELFREFDLLPFASAPFATLSRGQRYKTALAALIAVNPDLWLLDEPFASGMDPNGINSFKRHARQAAAAGSIIIYSTQILDAAERFSDRICIIHRGKVAAFDETARLRQSDGGGTSGLDELFAQLRETESQ
jgi:ABC-type multidrug transport system ATPase subunit